MSTGPTNLYDCAVALLAAVDTGFAMAGVSLPTVQYVTGTDVVAACNSVVVGWSGIRAGWPGDIEQPAGQYSTMASTRVSTLTVSIFRCLQGSLQGEGDAVMLLPTAAQMQADGLTIMTDGFTLFRTLQTMTKQDPPWYRDYAERVQVGPCVPIAASGALGGVVAEVTLELT